jgi:fumarate reductase flavoprotein subunit
MQAALANCVKAEGDSPDVHYLDTVRGSDWGADQEVARAFADGAPIAVRELAHFGVPWTRVKGGKNSYFIKGERVEIEEALDNDGLIMHRDFGGTAKWRACYAGAGTGHSALYAVDSEVVRLGVTVRDRTEAVELIHEGGRCHGVIARCLRTGEHSAILAKATVIATGGHGRIYGQYTTNATINEGMGAAIALNTGVVPLGNMEAVQFHPTALSPSGILVTMAIASWSKQSPRNRNSPAVTSCRVTWHNACVTALASRPSMGHTCGSIYATSAMSICVPSSARSGRFAVILSAWTHYSMGGIRVNKEGEAYNLAGLYAVGEASCWDMHGFNRLGGNSLAETIVSGRLVGMRVAKSASDGSLDVDTRAAIQALQKAEERAAEIVAREGGELNAYDVRDAMAEVMIGKVGIFRTGDELEAAVTELKQLLADCDKITLRSKAPGMNPELTFALRIKNMVRLSLITAMGALARTESRGAHFRLDHPLRDDAKWLNRTLARWSEATDEPDFSYEPVGKLDVPPGHRGYGADERIEMEQSIEDYNATVEEGQASQGKLPTEGVL